MTTTASTPNHKSDQPASNRCINGSTYDALYAQFQDAKWQRRERLAEFEVATQLDECHKNTAEYAAAGAIKRRALGQASLDRAMACYRAYIEAHDYAYHIYQRLVDEYGDIYIFRLPE